MIVVTGGAGLIGANLVRALNRRGHADILLVDDLTDARKISNIADLAIADFIDKEDFLDRLSDYRQVDAVFHHGACTRTTEMDGRHMMRVNYAYSRDLLEICRKQRVPMVYASSAAVYGNGRTFREDPECECPLNAYSYSKWLFDCYARRNLTDNDPPVVGLRYFNVYGPGEGHKDDMASIAYHLHRQIARGENPKLFGAYDGFEAGEQQRDFIHVDDAVDVTLWCWESGVRGVLNCGTGRAASFRALAEAVVKAHGRGSIEYIDFPDMLKGRYQSHTEADIARLRQAGYAGAFRDVASGVREYVEWMMKTPA